MAADPAEQSPALLIDLAEVCRRLSIGETTAKGLLKSGHLPLKRVRLCRKLLFSATEFQEWFDSGMPHSTRWPMLRELNARRAG
jgi:predicted DNA-binding transcriptional regulator AlpA